MTIESSLHPISHKYFPRKKSLSRQPEGYRLRLFAFDRKSTFILTFQAFGAYTGKHTGLRFISAQRAGNQRFSTLITTYFMPYLSAWMRRRDTQQFWPGSSACKDECSGGTGHCICAVRRYLKRSSIRASISYSGSYLTLALLRLVWRRLIRLLGGFC